MASTWALAAAKSVKVTWRAVGRPWRTKNSFIHAWLGLGLANPNPNPTPNPKPKPKPKPKP